MASTALTDPQRPTSPPRRMGEEAMSPSLHRLKQLKEKMLQELSEQKERNVPEGGLVPLSLADEYKHLSRDGRWRPAKAAAAERAKPAEHDKSKEKSVPNVINRLTEKNPRKEMESMLSQYEKERKDLELENQRLRDVITLRQEVSLRQENRCQKEIGDLKARLDATAISTTDTATFMAQLRVLNDEIQQEINQLKGIIESQAEVEKMNTIRTFRVKMHELKKQLAEEKQVNYTGAQEWIEKNQALQRELDHAASDLNQLKDQNRELVLDNRELKQARQRQEEQRNGVITTVTILKKENTRLQDQIEKLEFQVLELSRRRSESGTPASMANPRRLPSPADLPRVTAASPALSGDFAGADRDRKYIDAIARTKRNLESDRKVLKQARSQHMALVAERMELEIFLRQCIDDVRRDINRNAKVLQTRPASAAQQKECDGLLDQYTASDRKRILEILMSKERVLTLVYNKAFPYKHDPNAKDREAEEIDPSVVQAMEAKEELDMNHLWSKWKNWTEMHVASDSTVVPPL